MGSLKADEDCKLFWIRYLPVHGDEYYVLSLFGRFDGILGVSMKGTSRNRFD